MLNNHNERFTQKLNADPRKAIFQMRDRLKFRKVQEGWSFEDFLKHTDVVKEIDGKEEVVIEAPEPEPEVKSDGSVTKKKKKKILAK